MIHRSVEVYARPEATRTSENRREAASVGEETSGLERVRLSGCAQRTRRAGRPRGEGRGAAGRGPREAGTGAGAGRGAEVPQAG